jgi:hypothetical protein
MNAQHKAAKNAAATDVQVASYNAEIDNAQADQIQLDTEANLSLARKQGQAYVAKQQVSYAAAGVLADTGTPLQAEIASVGTINQNIQQEYSNSQRKQQLLHSQAEEGVYMGQASAAADSARGTAALLTGGAQIASSVFKAYDSGVFSSRGSSGGSMPTGQELLQGG